MPSDSSKVDASSSTGPVAHLHAILHSGAQVAARRIRQLPKLARRLTISQTAEQIRRREILAHSIGTFPPTTPDVIVPDIQPNPTDITICERLLAAYETSRREVTTTSAHDELEDVWTEIKRGQPGLFGVLARRDPRELAEYLCNMCRQDATNGTVQGDTEFARINQDPEYRQFLALMAKDKLVSLAEALGVLACENPEQGPYGESMHLDADLLVARIAERFGMPIAPPPIDGGLLKLQTSVGLFGERDFNAIYTGYLLSKRLSGQSGASVCEIGGGSGRVAYWSRRFGVGAYTIIDLPHINVVQGYYLLKSLPEADIRLNGEAIDGESTGRISILPDHAIGRFSTPSFDLVLNQDSFPEIHRDVVTTYLRWISRVSKRYLLSINHESRPAHGKGIQLNVPETVDSVGGFRLLSRELYWLRKGYVSMLYQVSPSAE